LNDPKLRRFPGPAEGVFGEPRKRRAELTEPAFQTELKQKSPLDHREGFLSQQSGY
jgi:hypothetical protein